MPANAVGEPVLQRMDWSRAMGNHQREEQLRAFLAEYPADLQRKVDEMSKALQSKDFDRLQEVAQQVMGSSSFVAAMQLHAFASELVEAIDLETDAIAEKADKAINEARALEKELVEAGFVQKEEPATSKDEKQACCILS
mmetsp:Transcript_9376/g.17328  ORF Transcript_9376/g.17328 Transcript_9376/m.17328 type:complete len:140 (-) Transcript_9376:240-659(-)